MEQLKKWRRDLHQIPELGLQEFQTAAYIRRELEKMGYQWEAVVETGTIVYIDYHQSTTIAFRSDIDALAIQEKNHIDFASKIPGMMHACGHDGHMSALLGFARRLKENHSSLSCNVLLVFQPAEESPGAAAQVVESGVFEKYNVKAIFGMHLMPFIEEGVIACKKGPLMAMCGELDVKIYGKGAHAGINIGQINGGSARNSVASLTTMHGTLRCYDENLFIKVTQDIDSIHKSLEMAYGCSIEWSCPPLYPPVLNDDHLYKVFRNIVDEDIYIELKEPLMLAEDFSFYQKAIPGIFFFLGTKCQEYQSGLHTETFNFHEEVLEKAIDLYEKIVMNLKGE